MPRIIAAEKLTEQHTAYEIEAPEVASAATAGQLLMARLGEQILFTPYAIADFEPEKGTVIIVARGVPANSGDATTKAPEPTDIAIELTGPYGKKGVLCPQGKILCVADNLGIAAVYTRLREYKKNGCYTIVIAGYPSKDLVYWQERLDEFSDELYVVTEDGTFGIRGPIQQTVRAVCRHVTDIDRALAVGPMPFLKACTGATRNYEIPTLISLNAVIGHEDELAPGSGAAAVGNPDDEPAAGGAAAAGRRSGEAAAAGGKRSGEAAGGKQSAPFDWHNASDLDGHTVDFDKLTEQLGILPLK